MSFCLRTVSASSLLLKNCRLRPLPIFGQVTHQKICFLCEPPLPFVLIFTLVSLTAVTLRHRPSGISVTVQDSRLQAVNRKLARERLLDAVETTRKARRDAEIAEHEKARRRKSPRPPALKRKILESKRKRGELK